MDIGNRNEGDRMILVIGGAFQGKRKFAEQRMAQLGVGKPVWSDGQTAVWEEYCEAEWKMGLPCMIKRRMETEGDHFSAEKFVLDLCGKADVQVIVSEEIGSGIVPMDAFLRAWREETGRIQCSLASQASEVWRVVGGIGQRIK